MIGTAIRIVAQFVDDDAELERQADGHEEQAEQDAAERLDVGFELVPVGGFGEHDAGDEGAHRHRQPGKLHQRRRPEHDQQRGGDHRLLGAGIGDDPEQRVEQIAPGDQQRGDRADRDARTARSPGGGASRRAGGKQRNQRQQRHDGEVLEQQDRERRLAELGVGRAFLLEDLHGEGRRRQRQPEADDDRGRPVQPGQQIAPGRQAARR